MDTFNNSKGFTPSEVSRQRRLPMRFRIGLLTGFTLIESLIYLALFAIIIGGGMSATYQIIEATNSNYNHVVLQEEANFLIRKIEWALTGLDGASSITKPISSSPYTDTILQVTKNGIQLTFCFVGTNLYLQTGATPCTPASPTLNSSNISVLLTSPNNYIFKRSVTSGKTDAITTSFTLSTVQNGRNSTESFSTTKYLRK